MIKCVKKIDLIVREVKEDMNKSQRKDFIYFYYGKNVTLYLQDNEIIIVRFLTVEQNGIVGDDLITHCGV